MRVSLVIRHKLFQLRLTPKIRRTLGILGSRDFRRIPSILHAKILKLNVRHRNSGRVHKILRTWECCEFQTHAKTT